MPSILAASDLSGPYDTSSASLSSSSSSLSLSSSSNPLAKSSTETPPETSSGTPPAHLSTISLRNVIIHARFGQEAAIFPDTKRQISIDFHLTIDSTNGEQAGTISHTSRLEKMRKDITNHLDRRPWKSFDDISNRLFWTVAQQWPGEELEFCVADPVGIPGVGGDVSRETVLEKMMPADCGEPGQIWAVLYDEWRLSDLKIVCRVGDRPGDNQRPQIIPLDILFSLDPPDRQETRKGVEVARQMTELIQNLVERALFNEPEGLARAIARVVLEKLAVSSVTVKFEMPTAETSVGIIGIEMTRNREDLDL